MIIKVLFCRYERADGEVLFRVFALIRGSKDKLEWLEKRIVWQMKGKCKKPKEDENDV